MSSKPASKPTLRSFWHDLPREGKLLLSVVVFEFIGTGLVLPFHVVYLHEVRGFDLGVVGLMLGLSPLIGFLVTGPGGWGIDHYGARRILMAIARDPLQALLPHGARIGFFRTGPA